MSDLISRQALREELSWRERVARDRVINTPQDSPCYQRYQAQLTERERLIELLENAPTAFDKEKVIQKLNEELQAAQMAKVLVETDLDLGISTGFADGYYNGIVDTIKTVKKGGVE